MNGEAAADRRLIDRALFHAARGLGRTSPNPMVGAVVVTRDGVVVGQGYHERAGDPHAEIVALTEAGARASGSTLYCTLEPCAHHGRTGPCAARIVDAGIARVVASIVDPNPLVNGRGFAYLRDQGVRVEVGLGAEEATALNRPFFTLMRQGRPFVILKAATSADGYISEASGTRTWFTSEAADRHAHVTRAAVDAIGVGVGTVLADDPLLTVRGVYRERPFTRVVFDRRLRTPVGAQLLSTLEAGPVIIISTAEAPAAARRALEAAGAEVLPTDGTFRGALTLLARRSIGSLLLEGGAALHSAAWDEGLVDFVRLYVSPKVLGVAEDRVGLLPNRPFWAALSERRVETLGPDVLIEGYVHGSR